MSNTLRGKHELEHGKLLASENTELIWGWDSPAGRLRAKRRTRLISDGANLGPGKLALEIGCGTGMFTEMFAKTGTEILAVDISPDLIGKAKERGLDTHQVKFVEQQFEALELENRFDAVIGSSILHHLEIELALPRIFSLLKPGGHFSFAEPNMLNPQVFLERTFSFLPIYKYIWG